MEPRALHQMFLQGNVKREKLFFGNINFRTAEKVVVGIGNVALCRCVENEFTRIRVNELL